MSLVSKLAVQNVRLSISLVAIWRTRGILTYEWHSCSTTWLESAVSSLWSAKWRVWMWKILRFIITTHPRANEKAENQWMLYCNSLTVIRLKHEYTTLDGCWRYHNVEFIFELSKGMQWTSKSLGSSLNWTTCNFYRCISSPEYVVAEYEALLCNVGHPLHKKRLSCKEQHTKLWRLPQATQLKSFTTFIKKTGSREANVGPLKILKIRYIVQMFKTSLLETIMRMELSLIWLSSDQCLF